MAFRGFSDDAVAFFTELEADNTKTFWLANKPRYESEIKQPTLAMLEALEEFGPFHTFRPYNDVRFSKNRPPYKTHIGSYGESEGGTGYYVALSASGLMAGGGYYHMASDQLTRFRTAVDADRSGGEIADICARLTTDGYEIGASDRLKTAPRGYGKDHPRIELLRRKGLTGGRTFAPADGLHTPDVVAKVRQTWLGIATMAEWLDTHVGPSMLIPEEAQMF